MPTPQMCLTDGFAIGAQDIPHQRMIGGDARSASIAAASIVAKVTRDRLMHRLSNRYPGYGFDSHVGYITPEHTRAVRELGPTPLHRRSFAAMAYEQLGLDLGI
jgi:ribonuclease HII